LDGAYYRIYAVEADWYTPSGHIFKVRAEGKRFIVRYDEQRDEWTLLSVFDGAELYKRPDVEIVTVDPAIVRAALQSVESCEHCHPDDADWPFAAVLDAVTGRDGDTDYLMTEQARCPTCGREITEHTLIVPRQDEVATPQE
jgi:hypothetical protein